MVEEEKKSLVKVILPTFAYALALGLLFYWLGSVAALSGVPAASGLLGGAFGVLAGAAAGLKDAF